MPFRIINTLAKAQPLVIGHRGASAVAPENTLAAFARAFDDGADGIELDVRLSRDGVPVVIHDHTLRRTGAVDGIVSAMTSEELATVDLGTSFNLAHPHLARAEYAREAVPALEQVFELLTLGESPGMAKATIYIEMKTDHAESTAKELSQAVVQLIRKHDLGEQAIVISFNLDAVAEIKKIDLSTNTGALFEPRSSPTGIVLRQKMIAAAIDSGADEILLHRLIARPGAVRLATKNQLRTVVWTVDDPAWMRHARSLGLHAVMTNNPALFRKRSPQNRSTSDLDLTE